MFLECAMSQEPPDDLGDEQVLPSAFRDDELTPTLGRYYTEAEKELGPEAPHFDVVKRALHLWENDSSRHRPPHHTPPGKDAE